VSFTPEQDAAWHDALFESQAEMLLFTATPILCALITSGGGSTERSVRRAVTLAKELMDAVEEELNVESALAEPTAADEDANCW
jgi:hypothetical protein